PNKFGAALAATLKTKAAANIARTLKAREFTVIGTRGWNEADFTAGGVSTEEVDHDTLGSRLKKGLYFAGEILDVDGARGGYNLAWAWASGTIAGRNA
ncbi:MAG: NAD(P)/FAD-dependent oxidoreductase, partial [Candidatus Omnitrophica bacterium]|nr:NAD(P)/FAD-dependent oxidoreductase [Candidatus Omnitrophota bacterium]